MDNSAQQNSETGNADNGSERGINPTDALDELDRVLAGDELEDDGDDNRQGGREDDEDEGSEKGKQPRPETLEAVAERLGLEVSELFQLKLNITDGDKPREVTLGELKDASAKVVNFESAKLAWEEERTEQQHELVRTQQTITDLVAMLPKSAITPQLKEALVRRRADVVARETELTKSVIREWRDPEVEARDKAAMNKHLETWGFGPNYLDTVIDHKTLRYIRESMRREQRILEAVEKVRTARKPGHKPSGRPSPGSQQSNRRSGVPRARTSQVDKVVELLDGLG